MLASAGVAADVYHSHMSEVEQALWTQVYLKVLKSTSYDNEAGTQVDRAVEAFRRANIYLQPKRDDPPSHAR